MKIIDKDLLSVSLHRQSEIGKDLYLIDFIPFGISIMKTKGTFSVYLYLLLWAVVLVKHRS